MGISTTSNYDNFITDQNWQAKTNTAYATSATSTTNQLIDIDNIINASTAVSNWGTTNYGNYFTTTDYSILSHLTRDDVEDTVEKILDKKEKEKTMTNDFSFGPYNTNAIRISPYGMAIKNKNNMII